VRNSTTKFLGDDTTTGGVRAPPALQDQTHKDQPMTSIANDTPEREPKFDLETYIDVDELAAAIAEKASENYTPASYSVVNELGRNDNMHESVDLVDAVIDRASFTRLYQRIFDAAVDLLDEWASEESGLWWPAPKPDEPNASL
jgi:hypothetical protein